MLLKGKVLVIFLRQWRNWASAIANVLIREGAHVYLCARDLKKLQNSVGAHMQ